MWEDGGEELPWGLKGRDTSDVGSSGGGTRITEDLWDAPKLVRPVCLLWSLEGEHDRHEGGRPALVGWVEGADEGPIGDSNEFAGEAANVGARAASGIWRAYLQKVASIREHLVTSNR